MGHPVYIDLNTQLCQHGAQTNPQKIYFSSFCLLPVTMTSIPVVIGVNDCYCIHYQLKLLHMQSNWYFPFHYFWFTKFKAINCKLEAFNFEPFDTIVLIQWSFFKLKKSPMYHSNGATLIRWYGSWQNV